VNGRELDKKRMKRYCIQGMWGEIRDGEDPFGSSNEWGLCKLVPV